MQRFKVACVVIDGEDVADFMLVDKDNQKFILVVCKQLCLR
jgi:hypothetical protein